MFVEKIGAKIIIFILEVLFFLINKNQTVINLTEYLELRKLDKSADNIPVSI